MKPARLQDLPPVTWSLTQGLMVARDLARDDDLLSHLLVDTLGTGPEAPLGMHKMDSARRMPKFNTEDILYIVRKHVIPQTGLGPSSSKVSPAVDALIQCVSPPRLSGTASRCQLTPILLDADSRSYVST
ncbi:hypothetical protein M407DRAFT_172087 [Tulasnella calospora MUT 4182]|uniref:Uncharacterized protein n=1 Tax=Tulasnella calospora MUT 4182 TaxID=1051891 RepID=A0A0C3PRZ8_9AGAM|nr:hypothetical protein M407DRAFT_172087 [Tulasnella calospora MUT 4182]